MSILPQAMQHPLTTAFSFLAAHLLPGSCLLCAADSQQELLCTACQNELPQHSGTHCPQCAEVTLDGEHCARCRKESPHFDRTIAHFRYEFPVDRIIHALKYGHQLAIAQWLGKILASHPGMSEHDHIIAMPLHPQRLQERGFNQSSEIARAISQKLQRPLSRNLLLRSRATATQAELALKERQHNVRGAFECQADLTGQSVLLIDDVMTSGATLNECARVLKIHGCQRVTVVVAARALRQY